MEDIEGDCQMASVPPVCSSAVFLNMNILPPQYQSFEESTSGAVECPQIPASIAAFDASQDFGLYTPAAIEGSAYAVGASSLPLA